MANGKCILPKIWWVGYRIKRSICYANRALFAELQQTLLLGVKALIRRTISYMLTARHSLGITVAGSCWTYCSIHIENMQLHACNYEPTWITSFGVSHQLTKQKHLIKILFVAYSSRAYLSMLWFSTRRHVYAMYSWPENANSLCILQSLRF